MAVEIRALDPKPGAGWDSAALPPVIPDVLMRAAPGGDWIIEHVEGSRTNVIGLPTEMLERVLLRRGLL